MGAAVPPGIQPEATPMTTFPCPWCDEAVALTPESWLRSEARCESCATCVELVTDEATDPATPSGLALAA